MRKIKRAFVALICLLLAAAVLLFTLENKQPVELSFLSLESPEVPLAFTILAGFVIGAFFAGLSFWFPLGHYKRKIRRLSKKQAKLEQELKEAQQEQQSPSASTEVATVDSAA